MPTLFDEKAQNPLPVLLMEDFAPNFASGYSYPKPGLGKDYTLAVPAVDASVSSLLQTKQWQTLVDDCVPVARNPAAFKKTANEFAYGYASYSSNLIFTNGLTDEQRNDFQNIGFPKADRAIVAQLSTRAQSHSFMAKATDLIDRTLLVSLGKHLEQTLSVPLEPKRSPILKQTPSVPLEPKRSPILKQTPSVPPEPKRSPILTRSQLLASEP